MFSDVESIIKEICRIGDSMVIEKKTVDILWMSKKLSAVEACIFYSDTEKGMSTSF